MLQVLVVSTTHLAWRQAMSARSPIHAASADYVFARRDTSAVTTCVVRLSSLNTSEWITELITNSSGMICSVGGSQGLRSATLQRRTPQNSSGLLKDASSTFHGLLRAFQGLLDEGLPRTPQELLRTFHGRLGLFKYSSRQGSSGTPRWRTPQDSSRTPQDFSGLFKDSLGLPRTPEELLRTSQDFKVLAIVRDQ